jgi:hypothetical protein
MLKFSRINQLTFVVRQFDHLDLVSASFCQRHVFERVGDSRLNRVKATYLCAWDLSEAGALDIKHCRVSPLFAKKFRTYSETRDRFHQGRGSRQRGTELPQEKETQTCRKMAKDLLLKEKPKKRKKRSWESAPTLL